MFVRAAKLVEELHRRGVAHCDLKLDNMLMLGDQLLLSDFSEATMFSSPNQVTILESRYAGLLHAVLFASDQLSPMQV